MYQIEPMPHKVEFKFDTGVARDQALLGDKYAIEAEIHTEEQVLIKSLTMKIVDIDSAPL